MNLAQLIGIGASIFTSSTLIPQLTKIVKEKNADGTSYWMLAVLFTGLTLWVIYGVMRNDPIIIIANSASLLITIATGIFTIIYRFRAEKKRGRL